MKTPLTRRQLEILEFIRDFRTRQGVSPTHREICERFGYSSYGTVHKHLRLLREKGLLRRTRYQRRGVTLDGEAATQSRGRGREIPFLGRIAAGQPIEAVTDDESLAVPEHLLSGNGDHFVLKVAGQSMVDDGIFDGDLVVVRRLRRAAPGDMVVALIDGEATLKRFYPEGDLVRLQPANPEMEPLWVPAERVTVQGEVVGLMRRFRGA